MIKALIALAGLAVFAMPAPASHTVARSCGTISDYGPEWAPNGRTLVVTRVRASGAVSDVYVIRVDGHHERRLNPTREYAYDGVWSPDGRRIAYSTFDLAAVVRIVVTRANGTAARVVASFQAEREPPTTFLSWSRDGRRIAYVDYAGDLLAADSEGQTTPQLLAEGATQPAWSPNGRQLAYVGPSGITIADADGSNARVLTRGAYPAWSPDSRRLAYTAASGRGVHVVDATGAGDRLVDPRGAFPTWQSGGGALVDATPSERAHGVVRVVDLRTGRVRTVTHDASRTFGSDDSAPASSPRATTIAFVSTASLGGSEIRLVRSDGRGEHRLTYHCVVVEEGAGSRVHGTWLGDVVLARNHLRDTILCGAGRDVVFADRRDRVRGCETVRR